MIRVQQLKLPVSHGDHALKEKIIKLLRIREADLISCQIQKQSLDARKKPELFYVYTVDVQVTCEKQVLKRVKQKNIAQTEEKPAYSIVPSGHRALRRRPVIIGTGPAGLFCGYQLARMGYQPVLIERGMDVDARTKDVDEFWKTGCLKPESNVQFGEGGAGTFSDGKLNTLTHDKSGRNKEVLRLFAQYGAPERILYENKPHIGTDILVSVVKNIRNAICDMGGEVLFHTKAADIHTVQEKDEVRLKGLTLRDTLTHEERFFETDVAVFAVGHSARDTFSMLHAHELVMEPKAFAAGVRMEHPQALINKAQYGKEEVEGLSAAAYKLTANLENGRGVYTFCMCPGGYVVNASSEEGRLVVNGMSYSKRDGKNANSAVIVTVTEKDFEAYKDGDADVLCGVKFQQALEEAAYRAGNGNVPVQLFEDFRENRPSRGAKDFMPQIKGAFEWSNVRSIFPEELAESLTRGILEFDRKIPGYADGHALVSGVESRTSSPIRMNRDEEFQSSIKGLYPCGEGAGYAGGITSAATDGLKVAEAVSRIYRPFDNGAQD